MFITESVDGKFEVYFGDGITGKALSDGNIVRIRYVVTNKTKANGASSFSTSATISTITNITMLLFLRIVVVQRERKYTIN